MAIFKITQKEYKKAITLRKKMPKNWEGPALYFEGALGYYKCTTKGFTGAQEIIEFQKGQEENICQQLTLL